MLRAESLRLSCLACDDGDARTTPAKAHRVAVIRACIKGLVDEIAELLEEEEGEVQAQDEGMVAE